MKLLPNTKLTRLGKRELIDYILEFFLGRTGKYHTDNSIIHFWHGKYHRLDGPAVIYSGGTKEYWIQGVQYTEAEYDTLLNRIECLTRDGYTIYFRGTKKHRNDGPAVIWPDGSRFWYYDNEQHRLDGPAAEYCNGRKRWYINDVEYTEADYRTELKRRGIQSINYFKNML